MSASFYWQPKKGKHLDVGDKTRFRAAMGHFQGAGPWTLTERDAATLSAMAVATGDPAYAQLTEALERHETIRVWTEC